MGNLALISRLIGVRSAPGRSIGPRQFTFHHLADLQRQYLLNGDGFEFFELAFALEEVVEGGQPLVERAIFFFVISVSSRMEAPSALVMAALPPNHSA